MRILAVLFNLLTGLFWLGLGIFIGTKVHGQGYWFFLGPFFAIMRAYTAFGLLTRKPWAFNRSLRTNLIGAAFVIFAVATSKGQFLLVPLIPLELLGLLFTFLGRADIEGRV